MRHKASSEIRIVFSFRPIEGLSNPIRHLVVYLLHLLLGPGEQHRREVEELVLQESLEAVLFLLGELLSNFSEESVGCNEYIRW